MNPSKADLQFKKVLLGVDYSSCAETAFPHALAMAKSFGGILYLVHITTPDVYGYAPEQSSPGLFEQIRKNAREQMAEFTAKVNFEGVPFQTLFGEGEVWDTMERMLAEHGIDLIVVSTHGRRGLKKLVMGSVTEEIIRVATVPVLTVGPHCSQSEGIAYRTILHPTDFSTQAAAAQRAAESLAEKFDATLVLLHAGEAAIAEDIKKRTREDARLAAKLEALLPAKPTFRHQVHVHYGHPGEEILKSAAEYKADLIVMNVRGAGSTPRFSTAFGSVAHHVVSQSPCPVLSLRG